MPRLLLGLLVLGITSPAFAEQSLLLVSITDTEWTDHSDCADDDCIPHNFWTVHVADVKKVIAGDYSEDTVRFVRLQHGQYIESIRQHLFVLVRRSEGRNFEELFGTNLVAYDTAYPRSLVCFDANLREEFPDVERFDYDSGTLKDETCFDQDMIENGLEDD